MVFYPPDDRRRPPSPMYSQRGGAPNGFRRQDEAYFYPNQMRMPDEAYFYPEQMRRPNEAHFYPNQMRRHDEANFYPNQMRGQNQPNFPPYPQPRPSRFERLPEHINTITNGIHVMRQIGSLLSMFRR